MNNEIAVCVSGWVAVPPELHAGTDSPWATFRLASTAWYWDAMGERRDANTTWFDVRVNGEQLVENLMVSLKKGDPVIVDGRIAARVWKDAEGREHTRQQIVARSVGHNLRWGKGMFTRTTVSSGPRAQERGEGQAEQRDARQDEDLRDLADESALLGEPPAGGDEPDAPLGREAAEERAFQLADAALVAS
ncbi:MAG: single-stranded DNA-binding protein [Bifidobacteriaceae bacterium]|nr:single-stranded DNA-binding protein [Bifidobacteriaceae bacterium]